MTCMVYRQTDEGGVLRNKFRWPCNGVTVLNFTTKFLYISNINCNTCIISFNCKYSFLKWIAPETWLLNSRYSKMKVSRVYKQYAKINEHAIEIHYQCLWCYECLPNVFFNRLRLRKSQKNVKRGKSVRTLSVMENFWRLKFFPIIIASGDSPICYREIPVRRVFTHFF